MRVASSLLKWLSVCLFSGLVSADTVNISGDWQHSEKPVVLYFDLMRGVAIVKDHQQIKNNEGLTVIKAIQAETDNRWSGEMYDGYQQQYVSVSITSDGQTLTVYTAAEEPVLTLYR